MKDWLESDPGVFQMNWATVQLQPDETAAEEEARKHVRFALGASRHRQLLPTLQHGYSGQDFAEAIWTQLRDRPTGWPEGFGRVPDHATRSQEALNVAA